MSYLTLNEMQKQLAGQELQKAGKNKMFYISNPQGSDSLYQRLLEDARSKLEREHRDKLGEPLREYTFLGIDWAKPGSDQTVVTVIPPCPIKPEWVDGFHPIVKAPVAPKQSEPDRIWDLIVLAAESSRYG